MVVTAPTPHYTRLSYQCLDLMQVRLENSLTDSIEDAVLLEIWEGGGLLQIDQAAELGQPLCLLHQGRPVRAHVITSCKDDFGYLVEFAVDEATSWFPREFRPAYILPQPVRED